jgi:tetratricopeptide (TPR) repeat protein
MEAASTKAVKRGSLPSWNELALQAGIKPEPAANGLALWLQGARVDGFRQWERIKAVQATEFTVEPGILAITAIVVQARQGKGLSNKIKRLFGRGGADSWTIPGGGTAEQWGERQSDCLLVWSENGHSQLDEAWIQSRWPRLKRAQQLGGNLFLVVGVRPPGVDDDVAKTIGCPRQFAEQLLASVRSTGDPRQEISALTDLGLMDLSEGRTAQSVARLEEALALSEKLGDRPLEGDVLVNIGRATLYTGDMNRSLGFLKRAIDYARESGDRFAEKSALEFAGIALAKSGNPNGALAAWETALRLANATGHEKQSADLHWHMAVLYGELDRRDQAIEHGQAAIAIMKKMGNPHASIYSDHLTRFLDDDGSTLGQVPEMGAEDPYGTGSFVISASAAPTRKGPGFLRMAVSAATAAAKFVGSGLKTVPPSTLHRRLRTCDACQHHTGLRCRLCGCFTHAKARLPHERCPAGKWLE